MLFNPFTAVFGQATDNGSGRVLLLRTSVFLSLLGKRILSCQASLLNKSVQILLIRRAERKVYAASFFTDCRQNCRYKDDCKIVDVTSTLAAFRFGEETTKRSNSCNADICADRIQNLASVNVL